MGQIKTNLQIPDTIFMRKFLVCGPAFRKNTTFEPAHVEQKVWVVLTVHRDETILPLDGGNRAG